MEIQQQTIKKTVPNDLALRYGKSSDNNYTANPKMIASIAYSNKHGNGSVESEDGWKYRGRGLLQITWKDNYVEIQKIIDNYASDSGVNIMNKETFTPKEAAISGMADWYKDKMFLQADKAGTMSDTKVVDLIVDIINEHTDSRQKRKNHFQKTKQIFNIDKCVNIKKQDSSTPLMISKYLSYSQAVKSDAAERNNVKNEPNSIEIENLKALGFNVYDVIYERFNGNVTLTSVFRNEVVNNLVGGSNSSQHRHGEALDIKGINGVSNKEIFDFVRNELNYHQIIWEFGSSREPSWVHIGYKKTGNRKRNTRAIKSNNRTVYIEPFDLY